MKKHHLRKNINDNDGSEQNDSRLIRPQLEFSCEDDQVDKNNNNCDQEDGIDEDEGAEIDDELINKQ